MFSLRQDDFECSTSKQLLKSSGNRLGYVFPGLTLLVLAAELGFFARRQLQTIDETDDIDAGMVTGSAAISKSILSMRHLLSPLMPSTGLRPAQKSRFALRIVQHGHVPDFAHGHDFLYSNDARKILNETRFFCGIVHVRRTNRGQTPSILVIVMATLTRIPCGSTFCNGLPEHQPYRSPEPAHAKAD